MYSRLNLENILFYLNSLKSNENISMHEYEPVPRGKGNIDIYAGMEPKYLDQVIKGEKTGSAVDWQLVIYDDEQMAHPVWTYCIQLIDTGEVYYGSIYIGQTEDKNRVKEYPSYSKIPMKYRKYINDLAE